jgi:GNAT superfamily N-acetyltransferase
VAASIRLLDRTDSIEELTSLLHRAYKQLADMGFRYVATYQSPEVTAQRVLAGECYVALLDGKLAGTILFKNADSSSGCAWYDKDSVATFHQFGVEPELQGAGIGSSLLEKVEERARETGAGEIALDTSEGAHHLIALYEKRGYRYIETVQWDVTNYRSVIMSKRLHRP